MTGLQRVQPYHAPPRRQDGEAEVDAARSFTKLLSSLARGKRSRAPVRLTWAALWLFTEAVDAWGWEMHRLVQEGALSKRMVAWA